MSMSNGCKKQRSEVEQLENENIKRMARNFTNLMILKAVILKARIISSDK